MSVTESYHTLNDLRRVILLTAQIKAIDEAGKQFTRGLVDLAQLSTIQAGNQERIERFDHDVREFISYLERLINQAKKDAKVLMEEVGFDPDEMDDDERED